MGKFADISRKRRIKNFSWGLASRMSDLVLLGLSWDLGRGKFVGDFFVRLGEEGEESFTEPKIKQVYYQLKQKGLIDYVRGSLLAPQITDQGRKRIASILPNYLESRPWDKHLYLISYDIPELKKVERNRLRRLLKTVGCGLLQESVWLTPYNPKIILEEFVAKNDLIGLVLVSDLGKNGSIGEEDNRGLVARVYQLDELNRRYWEFLDRWKGKELQSETVPHFFSILQDDPQLPFDLLPDDWLGEQAWELIKSIPDLNGRTG
ncbi:hypothetical protein COX59_01400 [Candidatus Beckwithbacteria bacterium CG_4_10_14_0_2_um_filter_47_25]|uniref:CRISPR-associated endoribonuclease Cas2 n=2 Tax=Candidatus Beckwithiibacteriota TaxID=1752726 RepID=A0A2H0B463_9BACT|nr:MAG: hypothetical protein COX09_04825 [Candidatus Beckwithbacteria bacterium CG23_combo_of_CG06-09_8_20_14_all_47_9]PJA23056.1 MAG: hypothetical protein COX59_01400 [Candidatus Beckwithbacteria bacterium CG_4_10_14_0_2_um_filter_47_25]